MVSYNGNWYGEMAKTLRLKNAHLNTVFNFAEDQMDNYPIYSLGHGVRKIDEFIFLLKKYQIDYVIDVRTRPASRFNPQYNRQALSVFLKQQGLQYVYMGDTLGGKPADTSCYDAEGRVNYAEVMKRQFFLGGIRRLEVAYQKNLRVACFCSESAACDCHRSKLIGVMLEKKNIPMVHINKAGELDNQSSVMDQVLGSNGGVDLFGEAAALRSRKAYL
jgi:uncharacterized protein (DUF488 family)